MKIMKAIYVGKEPHNMTPKELMDASTYCDSWRSPYLEELCRRTGNIKAYYENPMKAAQAAAKGYGAQFV